VKRSGPPKRRTPLRSSSQLSSSQHSLNRQPLRATSKRKQAELAARRRIRPLIEERDGGCVAAMRVRHVACWHPPGVPLDMHEVVTRGRGGSATDPANIILVCRAHHDWIGGHGPEAEALGLLAKRSPGDGLDTQADLR